MSRWAWWTALAAVPAALASGVMACNAILGIESAALDTTPTGTGAGGQGGTGGTTHTGCVQSDPCDDDNRCTVDSCNTTLGQCQNEPVADGPAPEELQVVGDCKTVVCSAGEPGSTNDDTDIPEDDEDCTTDECDDGEPSNTPLANDTSCTSNGGQVCYQGQCVDCFRNDHCTLPETCSGGGTLFECGCTPNACDELTCGYAVDAKCGGPNLNCNDQQANGTETDVDCGGPTVPASGSCDLRCSNGKMCDHNSDCATGVCNECSRCGAGGCGGAGGASGGGGAGGG